MIQMKPNTFRITIKRCLAVFAVVFVVLIFCNTQSMAAEIPTTTETTEETAG